jgi:hypothetical protein
MARISDGRIGVSVNAETVVVLDLVKENIKKAMGVDVSYTQAIQYTAMYYMNSQRASLDVEDDDADDLDKVTDSYNVFNEGE